MIDPKEVNEVMEEELSEEDKIEALTGSDPTEEPEEVKDNFLPKGYKEPDLGNYMKFQQGENTFRILSSAIVGMEYWVANKEAEGRVPVRKRMNEKILIEDLEINPKTGETDMPKHFWAFVVYNRSSEKTQILEITQKGIQKAIKALVDNEKWGDIKDFDITITKTGEGLETDYSVMPNPKEELEKGIFESYKVMGINLEALFSGDDPFAGKKV